MFKFLDPPFSFNETAVSEFTIHRIPLRSKEKIVYLYCVPEQNRGLTFKFPSDVSLCLPEISEGRTVDLDWNRRVVLRFSCGIELPLFTDFGYYTVSRPFPPV